MEPALREMDVKALEEEHRSLVADKAGELEYLQSLKERIKQLKVIRFSFVYNLITMTASFQVGEDKLFPAIP